MRLKPEEIKLLATNCGNKVLEDSKNTFKVPRAKIFEAIETVLREHFEEERRIEDQAQKLLSDRAHEYEGIQKSKAIYMIKNQIAKEKDFILSGSSQGRMSADKISHMGHLIADKLYDDDLMDFPDEDDGPKFFKQVLKAFFEQEDAIDEKVRKKISTLSSPPLEQSRDWEILYKKYSEEEKKRMGHE
ncbi:MAG: hypothetical protein COV44_06560 [Deltaproteobacteria bacterium CG11_big_fil_rev_8_21_14_0_20_45_16]|nr:MAG: hypothetical protein COV44_06560 [Deltaproteobacteria bacterium CG11_big_fil_rev_8_21_14_0_20_45_16]